jgi:hypothetical protein
MEQAQPLFSRGCFCRGRFLCWKRDRRIPPDRASDKAADLGNHKIDKDQDQDQGEDRDRVLGVLDQD